MKVFDVATTCQTDTSPRDRLHNIPPVVSCHRTPEVVSLPVYQYQLLSDITAIAILPVASTRLFLGEPPKKDMAVAGFGTGVGIHFSSSVGIDMGDKLDPVEFVGSLSLFYDLWFRYAIGRVCIDHPCDDP